VSSIGHNLLHERSRLERMLAQVDTQAELMNNPLSEDQCAECINEFDVAAGLCKWHLRTITAERFTLDFTGQTSETCVNLSFDTTKTPILYSLTLERSLFPNKLRFACKFSATVSSFLKNRMNMLRESYGRSALDSFSSIPGFVRRLALELVRADVVAMEIRALEQRHKVSVEFANKGNFRLTARFPNETDQHEVAITFLVSHRYPIAPPSTTIESFDKAFDLSRLHRLIKNVKPGFGGILRTLDNVKAFVGAGNNSA
jgi:hypothetical protein